MPKRKLRIAVTDPQLLNHPQIKALIEAEHHVEVLEGFTLILGPNAWYVTKEISAVFPDRWVEKMIARYRQEHV